MKHPRQLLRAVGAFAASDDERFAVAAPAVSVVDTTGAGDALAGALAARLAAVAPPGGGRTLWRRRRLRDD